MYETIGAKQPRPCTIGVTLFRCLQNLLNGKNFSNNDKLKLQMVEFFAVKYHTLYERGIIKLLEKWQKVI